MSNKETYRLVVCVDVQAGTPEQAYGLTYEGMALSGLDWESSDEWFGADGEIASPDELQSARMAYMADKPDSPRPAQVYIVTYSHKHGLDCCAYRTEEGALNAAHQLAAERVGDSWDEAERAKFENIEGAAEALGYFHEVELEVSYGECIEINERPLGD